MRRVVYVMDSTTGEVEVRAEERVDDTSIVWEGNLSTAQWDRSTPTPNTVLVSVD